jgi:threonine dehydrogenase-like Zn-dependent dehydrogenase
LKPRKHQPKADLVSQCAFVSLLDLLWKNGVQHYRIIAIDPHEERRGLIKAIYKKLLEARPAINPESTLDAIDIETAKKQSFSTDNVGFDGVIEVSLN